MYVYTAQHTLLTYLCKACMQRTTTCSPHVVVVGGDVGGQVIKLEALQAVLLAPSLVRRRVGHMIDFN